MVTNNTLSTIMDEHTQEIEATRRDLAQLNTMLTIWMDRLEGTFEASMAAMRSQIGKLTTAIQKGGESEKAPV